MINTFCINTPSQMMHPFSRTQILIWVVSELEAVNADFGLLVGYTLDWSPAICGEMIHLKIMTVFLNYVYFFYIYKPKHENIDKDKRDLFGTRGEEVG